MNNCDHLIIPDLDREIKELKQKLADLESENEKLRECVEFYADTDEDEWVPYGYQVLDCGKKARQTLKGLGDKK